MAAQPQRYGSIREFLDNLPSQPCIWQPENPSVKSLNSFADTFDFNIVSSLFLQSELIVEPGLGSDSGITGALVLGIGGPAQI